MKRNNLLVGLFCLGVLALTACGGKKAPENPSQSESGSSISEVSSSESESESSSSSSESESQGESSSESESESQESEHTHEYVFEDFIWTELPGSYTAVARYSCAADDAYIDYPAQMSKTTTPATCEAAGQNEWHAQYDSHEDTKIEVLDAIGHDWNEPEWLWLGNLAAANVTATFTCKNDPEHTHVENAVVTKTEHVDATCVMDGHDTYTATVTFGGKEYKDERVDNIPAYEHSDIDNYGFCELCGEYQGTELGDPDMPTSLAGFAAGTYYYRFNIDEHYVYKKSFKGPTASEFFFFAKYDGDWAPVTIGGTYSKINQPDDDYIYMVLELGQPISLEDAFFQIDIDCGHIDGPNAYGICEHCNQYLGTTITKEQYDTKVTLPFVDDAEYLFVRIELVAGQHINLLEEQDWSGHELYSEEYYLSDNDLNFEEVTNFNGLHTGSPSNINHFFSLDSDELENYDGFLYLVGLVDSQSGLENADITVSTTPHWPDNYGYCLLDNEYAGTTVAWSKFNTQQEFHYDHAKPVFIRFEEGYAKTQESTYAHIQYKISSLTGSTIDHFKFYCADGTWSEITLTTDSWFEIPAEARPSSSCPYIHVVFTGPSNATGTVYLTLQYQVA